MNTQLVKHDKQWHTWQWYNFEARNDAFASQRPEPDLVQTKKACIDHLCLLGDGSKLHKNGMEMYRREDGINEKKHQQPPTSSAPPYQILNFEQMPFILRRYPYFLVAQWTLEISVTAVRILKTSSIAWRTR